MAKTRLRDRAFTLTMAALFLFTAVATSAAVVISIVSSNNSAKKAQQAQAAAAAKTTTPSSTNNNSAKLAGKPLSGFAPVASIPTLQTIDTKVGTGATATSKSTVSAIYTGAVASTGIVFQSSLDNGPQPVSFPLNQVIPGWQKGIPGMKVGGTRRLLIPASLAYGVHPPANSGIPANSDLVFDVTLLSVK